MNGEKGLISKLLSKIPDFKNPKTRLKAVLYGGAGLLAVIFLIAISLPATSNPSFCGKFCHSMRREYFTWEKSSHANITCTACHVEQGLPPFFFEKGIEGPLGLKAELFGHEAPINFESKLGFEHISKDICERCHNLITRKVTPSRIFSKKMHGSGTDKYHNKHLKKGITCTVCHNRVVHKDVNEPEIIKEAGYTKENEYDKMVIDREYEDGMSMTEGCNRCHAPSEKERDEELVEKFDSKKAPKECTICHRQELLPIGHKDDNWRTDHQIYAKKDYSYCFKCHGAKARFNYEGEAYCIRCHAKRLVETWQ